MSKEVGKKWSFNIKQYQKDLKTCKTKAVHLLRHDTLQTEVIILMDRIQVSVSPEAFEDNNYKASYNEQPCWPFQHDFGSYSSHSKGKQVQHVGFSTSTNVPDVPTQKVAAHDCVKTFILFPPKNNYCIRKCGHFDKQEQDTHALFTIKGNIFIFVMQQRIH